MNNNSSFLKDIKLVFPLTLPVLFGYLALSLAYALVAVEKGFSTGHLASMSILAYGGALQMLAVDLFSSGASLLTLAVTTAVVQARQVAYGLAMVPAYRRTGKMLPYLAHGLTDETYAILSSVPPPAGVAENRYRFLVTCLDHLYWVAGTVIGCALTHLLRRFLTDGSILRGADFALTALFIVLALEQFLAGADRFMFVIAGGAALLAILLFGADHMLLPAVVFAVAVLLVYNARKGGSSHVA